MDRGVTPSVTNLRKNNQIEVLGTSLLDNRGKYVSSINLEESILLNMIADRRTSDYYISIPEKGHIGDIEELGYRIGFLVESSYRKIKVKHRNGRFHFDVKLKLEIGLRERTNELNVIHSIQEIENAIGNKMKDRLIRLTKKLQKHQVDPVGFGIFARALQYKAWKEVEDDWPQAFANATVNYKVNIIVASSGIML